MDIRKVKKLIELLEESDVLELEIKEGEESVRISRGKPAVAMPMPMMSAPPVAAAPVQAMPAVENKDKQQSYDGHVVESPMVGTFYESPGPGNPPFVKIGQRVNVGETLCIIEAMKILNQIESDVAGEVKAILCKNGDPVEYGQKLFVIK
ncbi:MAG TPA: acetyl-CoA carboxylase biotin carboxyl carrier protein [Gammaproteobacteria bacterium]